MEWFTNWWGALTLLQQIFACCAIPATVILIIQTLLLMFGFGSHAADNGEFDHDFDHDVSHDIDHGFDHDVSHDIDHAADHDINHDGEYHDGAHHASGVRLISVRGFVAFFAVGGWLGVALLESGVSATLSVIIAFAGGSLALLFVGWVLKLLYDMQESGNIDPKNAVAKSGSVYIRIPANRAGTGKINITIQGAYKEMDAVTDCDEDIHSGKMVQVVSVTADNTLVVRPIN